MAASRHNRGHFAAVILLVALLSTSFWSYRSNSLQESNHPQGAAAESLVSRSPASVSASLSGSNTASNSTSNSACPPVETSHLKITAVHQEVRCGN